MESTNSTGSAGTVDGQALHAHMTAAGGVTSSTLVLAGIADGCLQHLLGVRERHAVFIFQHRVGDSAAKSCANSPAKRAKGRCVVSTASGTPSESAGVSRTTSAWGGRRNAAAISGVAGTTLAASTRLAGRLCRGPSHPA